jgi:hypothetical protein
MFTIHEPQEVRGHLVHRNQTWTSEGRAVSGYGPGGMMYVTIRFDDQCQNRHQSFAITADVYTTESRRRRDIAAGGCMHEEIAAAFPELAPLIKWHLMGTDGPMHYVANTCYHAGNRDCNGLRKDESRQIRNGKTGQLAWILETTAKLPQYVDSGTCPTETATQRYVPWCRIGEGKERNFAAARSCAVWPEATDDQLSLERPELAALLLARLPRLIADFRADMTAAGFMWEPEVRHASL